MENPAKPTLEISESPDAPRSLQTEKPKEDRVKETVSIMKELRTLGIPFNCPEVTELRDRLNAYINEGTVWQGTVSFLRFGRIAEVNLPRRADKLIEIKLRVPRAGR